MKPVIAVTVLLSLSACSQLPLMTSAPAVSIAKIEEVLACMHAAQKTPSTVSRAAIAEVEETLEKIELATRRADHITLGELKAAAGRFDQNQKSNCNRF